MHYQRYKKTGDPEGFKPGHIKKSEIDRFWSKVNKTNSTDDCWIWNGPFRSSDKTKYGIFFTYNNGKQITNGAHRYIYEQLIGTIPNGLVIDHLCNTPSCVNPNHLNATTQKENVLRSNGLSAKNARKTHCPQGHPYDEINTSVSKTNGSRTCRKCSIAKTKKYRLKMANQ